MEAFDIDCPLAFERSSALDKCIEINKNVIPTKKKNGLLFIKKILFIQQWYKLLIL